MVFALLLLVLLLFVIKSCIEVTSNLVWVVEGIFGLTPYLCRVTMLSGARLPQRRHGASGSTGKSFVPTIATAKPSVHDVKPTGKLV